MTKIGLTNPQRRIILAGLKSFEHSLRLVDRCLKGGAETGILYRRKTQMDEHQQQLARQKVQQALTELEALAAMLGFEAVEESQEAVIRAEMSVGWATLEDCRPARLRGYGKMNPELAAAIDPSLAQLSKLALEISRLAAADHHVDQPPLIES